MQLIMPTEAVEVSSLITLIFGPPGSWKTSVAQTAESPLTLDFDRGIHRTAFRKQAARFGAWTEVDKVFDHSLFKECKTIVIDTIGRLLDLLTGDIITNNAKHGTRAGGLSQQGFGALKARFAFWINQVRNHGKDVVMICHDKEEKDGDTRVFRPDIVGSSYAEVMKLADIVGSIRFSNSKRVFDCNPSDNYVGKNSAGWPEMEIPPLKDRPTFLADLIADAKKRIGQVSAESAEVARVVDEWRATIDGFVDPAQFTGALSDIEQLPKPVFAQVRTLLWNAAKDKNYGFNKESRTFNGAA